MTGRICATAPSGEVLVLRRLGISIAAGEGLGDERPVVVAAAVAEDEGGEGSAALKFLFWLKIVSTVNEGTASVEGTGAGAGARAGAEPSLPFVLVLLSLSRLKLYKSTLPFSTTDRNSLSVRCVEKSSRVGLSTYSILSTTRFNRREGKREVRHCLARPFWIVTFLAAARKLLVVCLGVKLKPENRKRSSTRWKKT